MVEINWNGRMRKTEKRCITAFDGEAGVQLEMTRKGESRVSVRQFKVFKLLLKLIKCFL